jgi:hypothetical protein
MKKNFGSIGWILLLVSCSPQIRVATDFDRAYNIAEYATFVWASNNDIESGENPLFYNELNDKRIRSAVTSELLRKGYRFDNEHPSAILHYHIVISRQPFIMECSGPNFRGKRSSQAVYTFKEGTLIIDVMDAGTNNLIWRGYATSVVHEMYTTDELEKLIRESVSSIMEQLPRAHEVLDPELTINDLLYEGAY